MSIGTNLTIANTATLVHGHDKPTTTTRGGGDYYSFDILPNVKSGVAWHAGSREIVSRLNNIGENNSSKNKGHHHDCLETSLVDDTIENLDTPTFSIISAEQLDDFYILHHLHKYPTSSSSDHDLNRESLRIQDETNSEYYTTFRHLSEISQIRSTSEEITNEIQIADIFHWNKIKESKTRGDITSSQIWNYIREVKSKIPLLRDGAVIVHDLYSINLHQFSLFASLISHHIQVNQRRPPILSGRIVDASDTAAIIVVESNRPWCRVIAVATRFSDNNVPNVSFMKDAPKRTDSWVGGVIEGESHKCVMEIPNLAPDSTYHVYLFGEFDLEADSSFILIHSTDEEIVRTRFQVKTSSEPEADLYPDWKSMSTEQRATELRAVVKDNIARKEALEFGIIVPPLEHLQDTIEPIISSLKQQTNVWSIFADWWARQSEIRRDFCYREVIFAARDKAIRDKASLEGINILPGDWNSTNAVIFKRWKQFCWWYHNIQSKQHRIKGKNSHPKVWNYVVNCDSNPEHKVLMKCPKFELFTIPQSLASEMKDQSLTTKVYRQRPTSQGHRPLNGPFNNTHAQLFGKDFVKAIDGSPEDNFLKDNGQCSFFSVMSCTREAIKNDHISCSNSAFFSSRNANEERATPFCSSEEDGLQSRNKYFVVKQTLEVPHGLIGRELDDIKEETLIREKENVDKNNTHRKTFLDSRIEKVFAVESKIKEVVDGIQEKKSQGFTITFEKEARLTLLESQNIGLFDGFEEKDFDCESTESDEESSMAESISLPSIPSDATEMLLEELMRATQMYQSSLVFKVFRAFIKLQKDIAKEFERTTQLYHLKLIRKAFRAFIENNVTEAEVVVLPESNDLDTDDDSEREAQMKQEARRKLELNMMEWEDFRSRFLVIADLDEEIDEDEGETEAFDINEFFSSFGLNEFTEKERDYWDGNKSIIHDYIISPLSSSLQVPNKEEENLSGWYTVTNISGPKHENDSSIIRKRILDMQWNKKQLSPFNGSLSHWGITKDHLPERQKMEFSTYHCSSEKNRNRNKYNKQNMDKEGNKKCRQDDYEHNWRLHNTQPSSNQKCLPCLKNEPISRNRRHQFHKNIISMAESKTFPRHAPKM